MSFDVKQFREYIVRPSLALCQQHAAVPHTPYIEALVIATCAQETQLGRWLHQVRGPALGIYQIEPASLRDLIRWCERSTRYNVLLDSSKVARPSEWIGDEILYNLSLATIICRLFYYRVPEALPTSITFDSLWNYYKPYYNTRLGKADAHEFRAALTRYTDIRV